MAFKLDKKILVRGGVLVTTLALIVLSISQCNSKNSARAENDRLKNKAKVDSVRIADLTEQLEVVNTDIANHDADADMLGSRVADFRNAIDSLTLVIVKKNNINAALWQDLNDCRKGKSNTTTKTTTKAKTKAKTKTTVKSNTTAKTKTGGTSGNGNSGNDKTGGSVSNTYYFSGDYINRDKIVNGYSGTPRAAGGTNQKSEAGRAESQPRVRQTESQPEARRAESQPRVRQTESQPEARRAESQPGAIQIESHPEVRNIESQPELRKVEPQQAQELPKSVIVQVKSTIVRTGR